MWVYGSEALLSQTDEEFRNNSYQAMVFATALAIVLASCIGFLFARTLVSPINRMTTTAKAIRKATCRPHRAARRGRDRAPGRDVRRDGRLHRARPRAGAPSDHRRGA
ncbi:MAG: hypothetical protein ACLR3C_03110 [Eggerthella lenta]